ncbi:MAG: adenosylmethionine--8-amino-7-oxononanoate transaminase [Zetaproteobacteria bacterium CG_4_9_14_3_um_filter_49_83]|nr:MAG: adenosylmethionine--8-amino-7-oxononanoate transaminase [Zetaproteobacteria bacterium CG1_02_49_23]PIQ31874.1 MAG: adenosylmethionine--8-amino-7-oxononanoate transaminase [Zetaproteobacteria bacterium CG17_big_fil_post_rev_8_21_14_2_50_50_13]PIY55407.1 MAG: adenosylmethionine--8-amino-7-oxononanoate transaminase [Zetaproteobacteria bacterium CG_4_10_14_0_8_um_filter_49_80]PJA34578.1 MAG: adenosylmethionine--8-amino-7-oxononanoate transaminase [Zetaproteobacteria bacterium CG_4_9_14_3_um_
MNKDFFSQSDWLDFERRHVWHPYASMQQPLQVYPVVAANGVMLEFEDGRRVIDGMASWWCAIHGYAVPELNAAIEAQLKNMAHVMFGGLTHKPAAELAALLLQIAPENMAHVFFSDSGSVSVEVAIKMAIQYWHAQGKAKKSRLLTIRGGYHGDTFGAMSVCDPDTGMHHLFSGIVAQQLFADAPTVDDDETWSDAQIASFRSRLKNHHHELAAVILEPIVQGAGGMRFYAPEFLRQVRSLCDAYDVLLICDEIATGFGRTGTMFASEQAGIQPDIMCIGKALTGGYMTLAATLCSEKVSDGIHAAEDEQDGAGVLMHGPTFMANPLACAVAVASIQLLLDSPWQQRVLTIEKALKHMLSPCKASADVADVRVKGAIGVIEMKQSVDVGRVQQQLIEQGVWLRPFGKLIYTMPPYVIEASQLEQLTSAMCAVVLRP